MEVLVFFVAKDAAFFLDKNLEPTIALTVPPLGRVVYNSCHRQMQTIPPPHQPSVSCSASIVDFTARLRSI